MYSKKHWPQFKRDFYSGTHLVATQKISEETFKITGIR